MLIVLIFDSIYSCKNDIIRYIHRVFYYHLNSDTILFFNPLILYNPFGIEFVFLFRDYTQWQKKSNPSKSTQK
jgi:hypothetical protein